MTKRRRTVLALAALANINWPIAYDQAGNVVAGPRGATITRIGTGDAIVLNYTANSTGGYDIAAGLCGAPTPCGGETARHADTAAINGDWISISPLDGNWSTTPGGALSRRLQHLL
jgi:hypothetical protein